MNPDSTLFSLVVSALGASGLVISYFIRDAMGKIDKKLDDNTKITTDIQVKTVELAGAIVASQNENRLVMGDLTSRLASVEREIEMLRARSHVLSNYLMAIRLKAEAKGWDFSGNWDANFPGIKE